MSINEKASEVKASEVETPQDSHPLKAEVTWSAKS